MIDKRKEDKITKKLFLFVFVIFGFLFYLIPHQHDDLGWATQTGFHMYQIYQGYNGRILGNLLAFIFSAKNLEVVRAIIMSGIIVLISYNISRFSKNYKIISFLLCPILLMLMPLILFQQSLGWLSAFANYVPPILIVLIYVNFIKNILNDEVPVYSKIQVFFSFLLGISGSLFVEYMTIYTAILSLIVLIFARVKFKKFFLLHIMYLIGCFIGSVIMFFRFGYLDVAISADSYRSVSFDLHRICGNIIELSVFTIESNLILNITIFIVTTIIFATLSKKIKNKLLVVSYCISAFYITFNILITIFPDWTLPLDNCDLVNWLLPHEYYEIGSTLILRTVLALLFFANQIFFVLNVVKDKSNKILIIFPFASILFINAQLLVIEPLNVRMTFSNYLFIILYIVVLLNNIKFNNKFVEMIRIIKITLVCVLSCIMLFYLSIYIQIHSFENERLEYVREQVENDPEVLYIPKYKDNLEPFMRESTPFEDYNDGQEIYYKLYHDLPVDKDLVVIEYDEYLQDKNNN